MSLYSHAERAKSFKSDSRYPPLSAMRSSDPTRESQQNSSEEKEARDQAPDPDVEARKDFWSMVGNYMCRNMLLQEHNFTVPKNDFPVPLHHTDPLRQTKTTNDVLHEATFEDFWNLEGDKTLYEFEP